MARSSKGAERSRCATVGAVLAEPLDELTLVFGLGVREIRYGTPVSGATPNPLH